MTDLSQQRLLAQSYDAYERLVDSRMRLDTLLRPVRRAFAEEGRIPSWAGRDLLRAWAFALVKADEKAGGGTLESSPEWRAVMVGLGQDTLPAAALSAGLSTAPKMHRDLVFLDEKRARLFEPHVAPINRLTERIALETGASVPYVDPDSGGINARFLFVLETPAGPAALGSGMLSADNDDETAKNTWLAYQASGMARTDGLHWNAVPWYTGSETKNQNAKNHEVETGRRYLMELLNLAPDVRVVLALGRKAQRSVAGATQALAGRGVHVIEAPHPGPIPAGTTSGRSLLEVNEAFRSALKPVSGS